MKEFKGTPGLWTVDVNGVGERWNIDSLSGDPVAITNQVPRDKDWIKRKLRLTKHWGETK